MNRKSGKEQQRPGKQDTSPQVTGETLIGGLLERLGRLIDLADQATRDAGPIQHQGEYEICRGGHKGVFGFAFRTIAEASADRRRILHQFDTKADRTDRDAARDCMIDVFEEDDIVRIVAELPGVAEDEIHYIVQDNLFRLSTRGSEKYHSEIALNASVQAEGATSTYKNGMFELKLKKKAQ